MARKDFIGFTFDDIHSDDLGIVRVSDGNRYNEELQPEIKDITAEVPGMHGEYYFGSTYGNKEFEIDIAYDSLTETQFRQLRQLFSGREIHELIFDERPYKKYLVKLTNPIKLSYVCFEEQKREKYSVLYPDAELPDGVRMVDDGQGNRVLEKVDPWIDLDGTQRMYKGEGTISFISYFPFAKSVFKILPDISDYENVNEWAESSKILTEDLYAAFDIYGARDNFQIISEKLEVSIEDSDKFKEKAGGSGTFEFLYQLDGEIGVWYCNSEQVNDIIEEYGINYSVPSGDYLKAGDHFTIIYLQEGEFAIYNAGDIDTGFYLLLSAELLTEEILIAYSSFLGSGIIASFELKAIELQPYQYNPVTPESGDIPSQLGWYEMVDNEYILTTDMQVEDKQYYEGVLDLGILIDTNSGLIQGIRERVLAMDGNISAITSGNIYNQYIKSGYAFKFEPNLAFSDGASLKVNTNSGIALKSYVEATVGQEDNPSELHLYEYTVGGGYIPTLDIVVIEGKQYYNLVVPEIFYDYLYL